MKNWIYVGLFLVLLAGCEKLGYQKPQEIKEVPAAKPSLMGKTDSAWNSYNIALPLQAVEVIVSDETKLVDLEAKDVQSIPDADDFFQVKHSVGNRAFMSINRYEVEAPNLLALRPLDESTVLNDELPEPIQLPVGDVLAVWKNPVAITAGPIACLNAIVLADSEPSLILLDPTNLQLIRRFLIQDLIIAFTGFTPETAELSVLQGDLSTATYRFLNEAPKVSDPVIQLIGPSAEALARIEEQTAKLLSASEAVMCRPTQMFPIASEIDITRANLFRLTVEADGTYRIYIDGIGEVPYLLILFNEAGERIFSNVEYAAEKVLEQNLEKASVYYLVVTLFPENPANQTLQNRFPRLVVKQK